MSVKIVIAAGLAALVGGCSSFQKAESPDVTPIERIVGVPHREQAERLFDRGKHQEAASAYRAILSAEPDNSEARFGLAESLRLGGEPEAAKAEYLAIAENPAWKSRALEGLGQAILTTGDYNGAYEVFSAAVEEDTGAWRAWLGLAQLSDLARDWEHADAAYASALAASSELAIVYNNHGISMLARGEPEGAAELFRKALAADPRSDRAQTNLELANATRSVSVESVIASEPNANKRAQLFNNYGYVAMLQGRFGDAQLYFEAAIEAHPSFYAVAYENLKVLKALQANKLNE